LNFTEVVSGRRFYTKSGTGKQLPALVINSDPLAMIGARYSRSMLVAKLPSGSWRTVGEQLSYVHWLRQQQLLNKKMERIAQSRNARRSVAPEIWFRKK
jgi:hypothetical protein